MVETSQLPASSGQTSKHKSEPSTVEVPVTDILKLGRRSVRKPSMKQDWYQHGNRLQDNDSILRQIASPPSAQVLQKRHQLEDFVNLEVFIDF